MKKTFKHWYFLLLELLFIAVLPLIIVYIGYGGWGKEATKFKWYFGVLVAIVVVVFILKKTLVTPWIERQRIKAGNLEAMLDTEVDQAKIMNIEDALRKARLIETISTWVLPMLFLIIAFVGVRGIEREIVKFSGILGFVLLSEIVGFTVCILDAVFVKGKNNAKDKDGKKNKGQ